jgi:hypothetical protein
MSDPTGPGMMPPQPPMPPQGPPGQQPPGQQPGYGGGPQYQARKTNGLAVASMILGILWVCWIGSILAVLFGHIALSQIKKSQGAQQGRGFAITGLVLGYLGVVSLIVALLFGEWTWSFNVN